jgi:hypothetical protein
MLKVLAVSNFSVEPRPVLFRNLGASHTGRDSTMLQHAISRLATCTISVNIKPLSLISFLLSDARD